MNQRGGRNGLELAIAMPSLPRSSHARRARESSLVGCEPQGPGLARPIRTGEPDRPALSEDGGHGLRRGGVFARLEEVARRLTADALGDDVAHPTAAPPLLDPKCHEAI